MKFRRNSAFCCFVAFSLFTITVGCDRSKANKVDGAQTAPTFTQRVSQGVTAITPGPARNIQQFILNEDAPCVFLIGENHANVLSQKQEIQVIGQLLDAKTAEAVLMEGSQGPLSVTAFSARMSNVTDSGTTKRYWDRELAVGRIGAGEYLALTQPAIEVFGVEDMNAKAKMEIAYTLDPPGSQKRLKESHDRGYTVLQKGLTDLNSSGKIAFEYASRIQSELQAYRTAANNAETATGAYFEKSKPLTDISVYLIDASARAETMATALKPDMEIYEKNFQIVQAAKKQIEDLTRDTAEYNKLVPSANSGNIQSSLKAEKLKQRIDQTEAGLVPVIAANDAIEKFMARQEIKQLISLQSDAKTKLAERDRLKESLESLIVTAEAAQISVRDSYGVAANDECGVAKSANLVLTGVNSFYRDEAAIAEREQMGPAHNAELRERDVAMAANTAAFLKGGKKCVALVVGSAHLNGLTEHLKSHGMSVVRCDLPGNDGPTSHWELRAYDRRRTPDFSRLFSQGAGGSILPDFQIRNREWQEERIATASSLKKIADSLPARWSTEPVAGLIKGREIVVRAGPECDFPEAEFGKHVVANGTVPSRPDWGFEAYDREAARRAAATQSGRDTMFAYYYRLTSGPNRGGRIVTPSGERTVREFVSSVPLFADGSKPSRVVLFGEPDERNEGGILVSPTWRSVRGGGKKPPNGGIPVRAGVEPDNEPDKRGLPRGDNNGGGGDGHGGDVGGGGGTGGGHDDGTGGSGVDRGSVWGAVFDDHPQGRVQVYRTINPERAKRNLEALDKQDPLHLGQLEVIEEANLIAGLEQLPFTPTRGDHSQTLVIIARNVPEFRQAVSNAARAGKLANKQIALITCGDAFAETAQLRELLLNEGALMVWVPDRQITPDAASALRRRIVKMSESLEPAHRPATIDELINRCLQQWHQDEPEDPDLFSLELAGTYVEGPPSPAEFGHAEG